MQKLTILILGILIGVSVCGQNKIEQTGSVGIGTTTPDATLEVDGSTILKYMRLIHHNGINYIQSGANKNVKSWAPLYIGPFGTAADIKLSIDLNGYVGIGTTTPGSLLNVGTKTTNAPSTIAQFGQSKTNGEARVLSLVNSGGGSNQSTSLEFHNKDSWSSTGKIQLQQIGSGTESKMIFYTYNGGLKDRMVIDESGKIGIGNTSPGSLLNVGTKTRNSPSTLVQFGKNQPNGEARVLSLINSGGGSNQSTSLDFHNHSGWSPTGKIQLKQVGTDTKSKMIFYTYNGGLKERMIINDYGNVGIGTTNPGTNKLAVNGIIKAKEIKVDITGWSDFVFANDYNLKPLSEVEAFINENNHLPDVPNEAEVKNNGVNLGEMDAKLLQKIEELTLYAIQKEKEVQELKAEGERQKVEMKEIKSELAEIKALLMAK